MFTCMENHSSRLYDSIGIGLPTALPPETCSLRSMAPLSTSGALERGGANIPHEMRAHCALKLEYELGTGTAVTGGACAPL